MLTARLRPALVGIALLSACAHSGAFQSSDAKLSGTVTIEVTNGLMTDARVALDRTSGHWTLGSVRAGETVRFSVAERIICGFDAWISVKSLDGTSNFASETFVTWPGQTLKFALRPTGALRFADGER